ncbi:MAG: 50S ribosomal protein L11 methyltransferase [Planctomycetia bacterium]
MPWVVDASVAERVILPNGDAVSRDDFHGWVWERAQGLLGVNEGTMTAVDAAARGLIASPLVIDAAAAPADRDWVAQIPVASVEWWFADEAAARAAADLVAYVRGCEVRGIRADDSTDHDAVSRAAFGPIAVADFGVVRPAWEDGVAGVAPDGMATIFIEPGLGFGTGLHETTQLCLAALSAWQRSGRRLDRVLDFGSGSGILGIAAAVLGAARVDAVEIDEHVHRAVSANATRNGIAERVFVTADLPAESAPYDFIVANIVAPVLVEHAAALCRRVQAGRGCLVLSGLLADEVPRVADRYAAELGCRPLVRDREDWRCLTFVIA